MNIAAMSIWLRPLGWALFHSLWQGFILCLICKVCFILWSKKASVRYIIAYLGLSILFFTFVGTFIYQLFIPEQFSVQVINVATKNLMPVSTSVHYWSFERLANEFDQILVLLVPSYLLILGYLSFRMLGSYNRLDRFRNTRYLYLPGINLLTVFNNACHLSKFKRSIKLYSSELVSTPLTIGFLKPIVLIPLGMMSQLSPDQVEAIFLHEMAHIRRHDYLFNLFQVAIETILFFNPFSIILAGMIRTERENCCDDYVITGGASSLDYAHALLSLEEMRLPPPALSMGLGSKPSQLYQRIKRITNTQAPTPLARTPLASQILIVLVIILTGLSSFAFLNPNSFSQKTVRTVKLSLPQLPGLPELPRLPEFLVFPSYFNSLPKVLRAPQAPPSPKAPLAPTAPKAPLAPTAPKAPTTLPKAPPTSQITIPLDKPTVPLTPARPKAPAAPDLLKAPPAPDLLKAPPAPDLLKAPPALPTAPQPPSAPKVLLTAAVSTPISKLSLTSSFSLQTKLGLGLMTMQITDNHGKKETITLVVDTLISPDGQIKIKGKIDNNRVSLPDLKKLGKELKTAIRQEQFKKLQAELDTLKNLKIDTREIRKICDQLRYSITLNTKANR